MPDSDAALVVVHSDVVAIVPPLPLGSPAVHVGVLVAAVTAGYVRQIALAPPPPPPSR